MATEELGLLNEPLQRFWILGGLTPDFAFDAVLSEEHSQAATITTDPVETGFALSDHIYHEPDRLTVEIAVSDYALHPSTDDPFASSTSRSMKAFDLISKVKRAGEPISVVTGLKLYDNMMILNISCRQDAATASALIARVEFEQVTIANTRTVTVPPRKPGKPTRQGAKKVDSGTQTATDPDANKRKSVLLSVLGLGSSDGKAISSGDTSGLSAGIKSLLGPGASP